MLSALASLALLAALAAPGIVAVGRSFRFLTPLERFAHGSVLGIVVGTLALLPAASALGFTPGLIIGLGFAAVLVALVLRFVRKGPKPGPAAAPSIRALLGRLDPVATLVIGAFTLRWAFLWRDALEVRPDGLWAGHEYIWSDWPTHLGMVSSFAYGDNFPPQHPLFAGLPLSYHFLSDLTPAAFVVLGLDPIGALPLHSFVLSVLAALGLYAFVRRLAGVRSIATLALVLFLLGGGLGWVTTIERAMASGDPIASFLADPWDLRALGDLHIRFFNPYIAFLMSQRAYLYGLPLAMLALTVLGIAARRRSLRLFAGAGVVAGLLPLSHLPTLLALAMTTPFLVVLLSSRPWRLRTIPWPGWILFHVVWVAVATPQLLGQLGGGSGALSALRFQLGWVAGEAPHLDAWWWFWLKNVGAFAPLLPVALGVGLLEALRGPSGRLLPPRSFGILLAMMAIFVAANLFAFQPWDWDNHKILVYWFLATAILVAALLVRVWRRYRTALVRVPIVLAAASMVASASLENLDMLMGQGRYRMLSAAQIELAAAIRETTAPRSLIVSGMQTHDPVLMLAGRRLLMGYWGQLWVSGIPYEERQADVLAIYRLGPGADALLARYGVDYVVIGPDEVADLGANLAAFEARYPVAAREGPWTIFAVR
jgi:hypothetical protein